MNRTHWVGFSTVEPSVKSLKIMAAPYLEIHNPIVVSLFKKPLHFRCHSFKTFYWAVHFSLNLHLVFGLWNKYSGECHFSQDGFGQVPLR